MDDIRFQYRHILLRLKSNTGRSALGALFLFAIIYYWNAYLCDDAFITFRTLDNFVRGEGLRWNVEERVQVFTSPLQILLMAPFYWLIHDRSNIPNPDRMYWLAIVYSFTLACAGIVWLARSLRGGPGFWFVFSVLMSSQAFVTFTSSGLESVQTCLLAIIFYTRFLCDPESNTLREYKILFLVAGLAVLNRLDTALLFVLPCAFLALCAIRRFGMKSICVMFSCALPLLAWLAFSLVYFGFLFPNTYYSKIGLDVDAGILYAMGYQYLLVNLSTDPATLIICAMGICVCFMQRQAFFAGISALFYMVYIFSIGGDFLGFRFLAPPFVISALVLHHILSNRLGNYMVLWSRIGVVIAILYGLLTPNSPIRAFREAPVLDDVYFYYEASSLANWLPGRHFPFARFLYVMDAEDCRQLRPERFTVSVWGDGLNGFCRGPKAHFIDPHGITDPLMARLSLSISGAFRPAHLSKPVPIGYVESITTGENRIVDTELASYYSKLREIVSGPLFTMERWRNIWAFNFTSERRYTRPYLAVIPLPPEWRIAAASRVLPVE